MNNYTWLQQKLHQIVLSNQFIRETTFDVEYSIFWSEENMQNHVFIAGMARSGTTILLNALFESSQFSSLSYQDMPFVLAPNLWSCLSFDKENNNLTARAHNDGIKVSVMSPEAFEEVFWMTFDQKEKKTKDKFRNYVNLINHKNKKNRYLSKNNQNIRRLELISDIFPNAQILIPFRSPIQTAYSILSQHQRFIDYSKKDKFLSNYMNWIGHTEFGPNYIPIYKEDLLFKDNLDINHWVEQWFLIYNYCLSELSSKENVSFICYEKLCSSKNYWKDILKSLGINAAYAFDFQESSKTMLIDIDNSLMEKTSSLYSEMLMYI